MNFFLPNSGQLITELWSVPRIQRKLQRRLGVLKGAGSLLKIERALSRLALPVTRDPFTSTLKTRSSLRGTLIGDSLSNGVAAVGHSLFFFRGSLLDGSVYYLATGPSASVGVVGHAHRTRPDILAQKLTVHVLATPPSTPRGSSHVHAYACHRQRNIDRGTNAISEN